MIRRPIDGLLFDKDGTLFDFRATWDAWAAVELARLAAGDADLLLRLADALAYDLRSRGFRPDSLVIAGTNREVAEALASELTGRDVDEIERELKRTAANAPLQPAVPLEPLLDGLLAAGLALGVMTNDSEFAARAHLTKAGVSDRFAFIAGSDSGHGGKPSPEPLLAFARMTGLDPARVAMIGDSTHDLVAGRAAGMVTVAVLTGTAGADALEPHADVVLPDIGALPEWLGIA